MIRAIVVDDEKLVRKGFISIIEWSAFGIEIIGEAGDGRAALELIREKKPELLITDITMPGMSGFELIELARVILPNIKSVVLTCHHEFDYVHEALRLGAIDYIVKTLIEMDNIEPIIQRIVDRIRWENEHRRSEPTVQSEGFQSALVLVPEVVTEAGTIVSLPPSVQGEFIELECGYRMLPLSYLKSEAQLEREAKIRLTEGFRTVHVTGLVGQQLEDLRSVLTERLPDYLFYLSESDKAYIQVPYTEMGKMQKADERIPELEQYWQQLKWAFFHVEWERFTQEIERVRPSSRSITDFAEYMTAAWLARFGWLEENHWLFMNTKQYRIWKEWRSWFREASMIIQTRTEQLEISKEVVLSLVKAIRFVYERLGNGITQEEVALHVNMSRSYFSQCFKKFVGESFGDFLRNQRIEDAKRLLGRSDYGVYEIASMVGFEDEKYFSRVFREKVGLLPTEYRANSRKTV